MSDRDEVISLLRSIDASLKQLVSTAKARAPKAVASDSDLDGRYGDPVLRFLPRDWTGDQAFKGRRFSECPPELLDMVADTLDWFGQQADEKNERTERDKPVGDFKRADAARARGWAKRMRDGKHQSPALAGAAAGWANDDGF